MEVWIYKDPEAISRVVADEIAALLNAKDRCVLALAAGRTPTPVYDDLVERHRAGQVSFAGATFFALDEYLGCPRADPRSFAAYFARVLLAHVDLAPERVFMPDGVAGDPAAECRSYEDRILSSGGIDLCLLGIGSNGHLAFNEPGPVLAAQTHVAEIADETRALMGSGLRDVRFGLTMGMAAILNSRRVILMATGPRKADIVARALLPIVDARVPASFVQLHPNAVFALDRAAAITLLRSPTSVRHALHAP